MFVCFGRRCRSPVCNENGYTSNMQLNTNPPGPAFNGSVSLRRSQQQQQQHEASRTATSSTPLRHIFRRSSSRKSSTLDEGTAAESRANSPTVTRSTPILYTTNRGLHLRVTPVPSPHSTASAGSGGLTYDFHFCDLERWSTNRTHTLNLEDTFTVAKHSSSQLLTLGGSNTSDTYLSYSNR